MRGGASHKCRKLDECNITNQDPDCLEQLDYILQRKVLSFSGNTFRAFMMIELGIIPVRFEIMQKQMQFLQYILKESIDSMLFKL